jgi:hypothetical protein
MNFIVIGTDHRLQKSDVGFEGLLRGFLTKSGYCEPIIAIAEEYHDTLGCTAAQRLATEFDLLWFNIDMSDLEKEQAGILEEQRSRPTGSTRLPSDDARERFWVSRLNSNERGTTVVVCGSIHLDSLVEKLNNGVSAIDQRLYLEKLAHCVYASE